MTKKRRNLNNRKILYGITGSVAAYKAVELIRRLKDEEASVNVIMTDASRRFITPLSIEAASGSRVLDGIFDDPMAHIELAREAHLMLVAPATANTVGKMAAGTADNLLSACFLSFRGKVLIAPAMNWRMYENPVFRKNLDYLKGLGVVEIPPEEGRLACGEEGKGRMADVEDIVEAVRSAFAGDDLLAKKIVITAGPTREFIDSVRFVSNRSSGKMGFALARAAMRRGAEVTLISGPVQLEHPHRARIVSVTSAAEMKEAVLREIREADALVMSAAVADLRPKGRAGTKLPKTDIGSLELEMTDDILAEVGALGKRPVLIGFAAEDGDNIERAAEKLSSKGADYIVFNNISDPQAGFEVDTNRVSIIGNNGSVDHYPLMSKDEVADVILDRVSGKGDEDDS